MGRLRRGRTNGLDYGEKLELVWHLGWGEIRADGTVWRGLTNKGRSQREGKRRDRESGSAMAPMAHFFSSSYEKGDSFRISLRFSLSFFEGSSRVACSCVFCFL